LEGYFNLKINEYTVLNDSAGYLIYNVLYVWDFVGHRQLCKMTKGLEERTNETGSFEKQNNILLLTVPMRIYKEKCFVFLIHIFLKYKKVMGDRCSSVVKVLC